MAEKPGPGEMFDLVKSYAKQEILGPLHGSGRWISFGLMGSVLLMLGLTSLSLALLRVLQEETGSAFTGNLSWLPGTITLVAVSAVLVLLVSRISKRSL